MSELTSALMYVEGKADCQSLTEILGLTQKGFASLQLFFFFFTQLCEDNRLVNFSKWAEKQSGPKKESIKEKN